MKISCMCTFKGTVAWDFPPTFFFIKITHLGPWFISYVFSNLLSKIRGVFRIKFWLPAAWFSGESNLSAALCSGESNLSAAWCSGESNLTAAWCSGESNLTAAWCSGQSPQQPDTEVSLLSKQLCEALREWYFTFCQYTEYERVIPAVYPVSPVTACWSSISPVLGELRRFLQKYLCLSIVLEPCVLATVPSPSYVMDSSILRLPFLHVTNLHTGTSFTY
jgi:hypothetical protein